ncbi:MAG: antitoxin Xre-like helix-turn-helix domain-containing protein [Ginsengibacter sp.]
MKNKKNNTDSTNKNKKVEEPMVAYSTPKVFALPTYFSFQHFQKVAEKTDFTQKEWADILHISERTLQRYAKDNTQFNFSISDRIAQIDKVIERGKEVFGSYDKFLSWLRDNPFMMEDRLSLQSLASIYGTHNILTQLGRIQHGLFA